MTNSYYVKAANIARNTNARAEPVNQELQSIQEGFEKIPDPEHLNGASTSHATDTGTANAYVVAVTGGPLSPSVGTHAAFFANAANTGASTLTYAAWDAKAIKRGNGDALVAGDIAAGQLVELRYSGSYWALTGATSQQLVAADASATAAASSATAAAGSATAAAASATTASTSESNAVSSATSAAGSATSAATGATAAATALSAAETARTAAESARTTAQASETNSAFSASSADTSATAAAGSATSATASATAAAGNAANAAASEANAAMSEGNASSSVTAASTAQTAAEAAQAVAESLVTGTIVGRDFTVSTLDPSGGANGDIWFKVT